VVSFVKQLGRFRGTRPEKDLPSFLRLAIGAVGWLRITGKFESQFVNLAIVDLRHSRRELCERQLRDSFRSFSVQEFVQG
jgi:hypothetical protein